MSLDITKELGDDVKHRTLLPRQFRGLSWGSLQFQCGAKFRSKLFINDFCHDWCVHMPEFGLGLQLGLGLKLGLCLGLG